MALTIFYNTKCPVCDAGISRQKRKLLDLLRQGKINFVDINFQPDALAGFGIGVEDIRKRLHALDDNGRPLVGVDVAIAVWAITPGEKWIAQLLGNRLILPLTRLGYNLFAELLYFWNIKRGSWVKHS